jgi:hypothetical protein
VSFAPSSASDTNSCTSSFKACTIQTCLTP